jgi:hypothetical protein
MTAGTCVASRSDREGDSSLSAVGRRWGETVAVFDGREERASVALKKTG